MKLLVLILVSAATVSLTTAAILFGGGGQGSTGSGVATAAGPTQHLIMYVTGASRDRVVGANLVVAAGREVTLTIVNHSRVAHTFTIPELRIEKVVLPGTPDGPTTTTVTFRAGHGVYSWWCRLPCGDMDIGHMGGEIYALDNPPVMHGSPWAQPS